ncbi:DUF1648 domain-containing protein [uncultured Aquimarina sp.]|uniref:DUF1648 domain-containing protein n=1 Tax=uncultured Aquimarina sp. TaxID=575652 RepID=UPI0026325737|nr:DUF1648 domain-containing protein [uncultured Aquimarina sp.]
MGNPIINIKKDATDIVFEVCAFIGLGVLLLLPIIYNADLLDQIPTHFNAKGEPDNYSSKTSIWVLPVIGLLMVVGLYILNKFPHKFNYPSKISEDSAPRYYKITTRLIRVINLIIAWSFAYILYGSIQVAIGVYDGLGNWFLPVFIGALLGVMIYFILKSRKITN